MSFSSKTMPHGHNMAGFTLLELMIGVVILSFVFLGIGTLVRTQTSLSIENQGEIETQAALQSVASIIRRDIVMTGFGGADSSDPFAHVNVSGTAAGGDSLTLFSTASPGGALSSFVIAGAIGVGGNKIWVRCFGETDWSGKTDPSRDLAYDPHGATLAPPVTLWISFYSPFTMQRIASTPVWTKVIGSNPTLGGNCVPNGAGLDANADGVGDPAMELEIDPPLATPINNGTIVYGIRHQSAATPSSAITYALNGTGATSSLTRNGMLLMRGIEDFQVQYRVRDGGGVWLNDIAGVDTNRIEEVRFGMIIRQPSRSNKPYFQNSITLFDHTYTIADLNYDRKVVQFSVRPKNNGLIEIGN